MQRSAEVGSSRPEGRYTFVATLPVVEPPAPSAEPERQCPDCGSDRWKAREYDRLRDRAQRLARDAERLARDNGLLTYRLRIAEADAGGRDVV